MKNILIITVGNTSQVVTETVWALLERADPFVPDRIHLVTTAHGKNKFSKELLGEGGKLAQLFRQKGYPYVEPDIDLPEDDDGNELDDIRTEDQNIAYANKVSRLIKRYADEKDTKIHVSLAGGRKTMSHYAGAAISLFGRDPDELSHVLVEPEIYEKCPDFWWPDQQQQEVTHFNNDDKYQASDARIDIALIPFVRLSHILSEEAFPEGRVDYARVVALVQESLDAQKIKLITRKRKLVVGKRHEIVLANREYALYRLCAQAQIMGWKGAGPNGLGEKCYGWISYDQLLRLDGEALNYFFKVYDATFLGANDEADDFEEFVKAKLGAASETKDEDHRKVLLKEARKPFINAFSKLRTKIVRSIDNPAIANRIKVHSEGKNPARFGLFLESNQIEIDESIL